MEKETGALKGHTTFLYDAAKFGKNSFAIIDRIRNVYKVKNFNEQPKDEELEAKICKLVSQPVECINVGTEHIKFAAETKRGKLKFEQIGQYQTLFYKWAGIKLTIHKRHEHLAPELVSEIQEQSKRSSSFSASERNLQPPKETTGTFEQYMARKCYVGRAMKVITWEKPLKGSVALANNFPISSEKLTDFFGVESQDFKKLMNDFAEFFTNSVPTPPGFPVYLEIPVIPTTKFYIKISDFDWNLPDGAQSDPEFFKLPADCELVSEL